jgi:hypothetical protein
MAETTCYVMGIFLKQLEKVVITFHVTPFQKTDPAFPSMMIVKGRLVVWGTLSWQIIFKLTVEDLDLAWSGSNPWTGSVLTTEGFHLS